MSDRQLEPETSAPLFSVIVPLEYHRGQWERAWQAWQSQTLDRAVFELILVVPPDFPQRERLLEVVGSAARLEYSSYSHDMGLSADGAARARGTFLFFTESHCWPEPDVLELCLKAFRDHSDWTGFSCRSVRVCHNRLSEVEADMYEADTEYGMLVHPWRKILDVCFATRRDSYLSCGGLEPEFGHYAEWLLAANYAAAGFTIGYLPEARVHHYYIGSFADLKAFTLDFVDGEIRYFSRDGRVPRNALLEMPREWNCRDNFEPGMAREILHLSVKALFTPRAAEDGRKELWGAIGRWIGPAIFGDALARGTSAAAVAGAYLAVRLALVAGSREQLRRRFKLYIAALIRRRRLVRIRAARRDGSASATADGGAAGGLAVVSRTGFYPEEIYQGDPFRWSETEAAVQIRARPGRRSLRIKCATVRHLSEGIDLSFYFDGGQIAPAMVLTGTDDFEIQLDVPFSGSGKLGWICRPFPAKDDPRRLGLPVRIIELIA